MKILLLALSLFSSAVFAYDFDDAGCGLGSMLWAHEHPKTKVSVLIESTTNSTTGSQILGISSDTSNCIDSKSGYAALKLKMYIEANRSALNRDIARGDGETIDTLGRIFDCTGQPFGPELQKNYKTIFPSAEIPAEDVSRSIRSILHSSAFQCEHLG